MTPSLTFFTVIALILACIFNNSGIAAMALIFSFGGY